MMSLPFKTILQQSAILVALTLAACQAAPPAPTIAPMPTITAMLAIARAATATATVAVTSAPMATQTVIPPTPIRPTDTPLPPTPTPEPDWLNHFSRTAKNLAALGNPNASVTMIDYSDFM